MCGIAGCLALRSGGVVDAARVRQMTEVLRHRGPDSDGHFSWPADAPRMAFGARRLAIVDLETGDQPFFSEDAQVAVVSNGEIYNYVELRAELTRQGHIFRSTGDTEVLVHLYEEHGLGLFDRLRGMYAFALWDARNERLVLAVDHLGIKPLYVCQLPSHLVFASEAKALFADPRVPRRPAIDAVDAYLTFGYSVGDGTLFDGIERLAPGTACVIERGQARRLRHWTPRPGPATAVQLPRAAVELREVLGDAVRLHLRSDVPIGLFLSGGVDSAGLLALMHREAGRVQTFTIGYSGQDAAVHDEAAAASRLAAWAGARHTELRLSPSDWWDTLEAFVTAHDEPNANSSMVSLQALARVASRDVKVVLNGTGGDELFGGYAAHRELPCTIRRHARAVRWLPAWARNPLAKALAAGEPLYPSLRRYPLLARLPQLASRARAPLLPLDEGLRRQASFEGLGFTDYQRRQLYGPDLIHAWRDEGRTARIYRALLDDSRSDDASPEDLAQALIMRTWLPGNGLLALDKVTMAHALEARVPYFDRVLVEHVMRWPAATRLQPGKALLRAALAGDLPAALAGRRKQPFETPLRQWLDHDLAERIRTVLLDPGARIRAWFNVPAVEAMLRRQASRRTEQAEMIFRLLVLELWWRLAIGR